MDEGAALEAAAEHWDRLAAEALDRAAWDDIHVGSGAPSRHKADTYKRAARALRLEAQTGEWHCVCCLKPSNREKDFWKR